MSNTEYKYLSLAEVKGLYYQQPVVSQTYKGKCVLSSSSSYVRNNDPDDGEKQSWAVKSEIWHILTENATFAIVPNTDFDTSETKITSGSGIILAKGNISTLQCTITTKTINGWNYPEGETVTTTQTINSYRRVNINNEQYTLFTNTPGENLIDNNENVQRVVRNLLHAVKTYKDNVSSYKIEHYDSTGQGQDREFINSDKPVVCMTDLGYSKLYEIINNNAVWDIEKAPPKTATNWNIYIDGTKNPLYKLTWDCVNVQNSNTSKVKVLFCGMDDAVLNTYIVKESHYYNYNDKSVKLNYHDIREAVWGDMGLVKAPVAIIVQFEYFDTTTVIPKDTSSYMYCELFPNETNGHMYGDIGFCEIGEHSTWFVKTDNGDGSTFTAHDGKDGADGYTKDDDKGYDDNKDKDDDDDDTHVLSSGIGVLTSTFHMTKERLTQLGQFLWGSSIFDEFSLINNNPIENIISCKAIPYAISGTTQEIALGNVKTGVNGEKISQNFSKQTIGSVAIAEHYKNFLDYAPYTNVIIYLPYIGFKELDTSLVMGKTLRIEYTLDVITGGCLAQIYVGKIRLYEFTGNIGVDIPITASNRAQVESSYISASVGVVSSAMSGNAIGVADSIIGAATSQYHYSGTGNPSPSCVASTNRTCYVVIDRPQYQPLNAFNHTRGRMCCLSKTIGNLRGYTVCDKNVDISGISATDEEKEEIVNILSSGFFA